MNKAKRLDEHNAIRGMEKFSRFRSEAFVLRYPPVAHTPSSSQIATLALPTESSGVRSGQLACKQEIKSEPASPLRGRKARPCNRVGEVLQDEPVMEVCRIGSELVMRCSAT
jgi:hypothetical protein